jgi:hypothetical protein
MRPKLIKPKGSRAEDQASAGVPGTASDQNGTVDMLALSAPPTAAEPVSPPGAPSVMGATIDLERRRQQLTARVAELQWDLGGLVYEMAIRDRIRVDILVRRAAVLQNADAELGEVQRLLRMEKQGTAGTCGACGAPHSSGAVYCWQCGQSLLPQVSGDQILAP